MTTSVPPKTEERELSEPSFPIVYVTDLLKAFVKAVRAHQLYLPNNPMHARSLEAVMESFAALWVHTDEIDLQVVDTRLEWGSRVILDDEARTSEAIAWLRYNDAVRELKILKAFEQVSLG